jgi:hypothetical protein
MNNAMTGSMNGRGYLITSKDGSIYKMEVLQSVSTSIEMFYISSTITYKYSQILMVARWSSSYCDL